MEQVSLSEGEFRQFRQLIHRESGIALSDGKRELVKSRLQKRLRHLQLTRFQDYFDLVVQQGESGPELREMINCITTNKTDFFREPHHFEFVARQIIPAMVAAADRGEIPRRLRVWHAGCSTGEEPYTLAITLAEALAGQDSWDVRLLASDIDTNVLAHAERGIYEEEKITPIPEPLRRKYLLRGSGEKAGYYRVKQELQEMITFRQINLQDTVFPIRSDVRFDMIFCRNVIIYFDKPTQRVLFAKFVERLRPNGHLFLGHSESLFGVSEALVPAGATIYRLRDNSAAKAS